MAKVVEKPEVLSPVITISVDGADREIFMSFGLMNELTKLAGSPDLIPKIELDPEFRDIILISLLAERKRSGKIISSLTEVDDVDISIEDMERLLSWATEHLMVFLVRSVQRVNTLTERHKPALEALVSSLTG